MRRSTSVGIVLVGVLLANGFLLDSSTAAERTTLSSLVGRLFKFKKSAPVEPPAEPLAVRTSRREPRFEPPDQVPLSVDRTPAAETSRSVARRSAGNVDSLNSPPLPPAVAPSWVRPPAGQPERVYSPAEVLALTRRAGSAESSRRRQQSPPPGDSGLEESEFNPAVSTAIAKTGLPPHTGLSPEAKVPPEARFPSEARIPLNQVRQVNHVTGPVEPAVERVSTERVPTERVSFERELTDAVPTEREPIDNLPIERVPSESLPIGNMPAEVRVPAEVRMPATDEPLEAESALPAWSLDFAQAPPEPSPTAGTLPPVYQKVRGRIASIEASTGVIRVDLSENEMLPAETKIRVYHEIELGDPVVVHLRVVDSIPGVATARLIDAATLDAIAAGDRTVAWKTDRGE